ncbi:MAG: aminoglycoside phosphotransferase family protein [Candidatus Limnocylindria bacterium]
MRRGCGGSCHRSSRRSTRCGRSICRRHRGSAAGGPTGARGTRHGGWSSLESRPTRDRAGRGRRELLAASPAHLAAFEEGYSRMRELIEHCPEERHLVHDDLMNFNVLADGDRISAVLDWGSSKYGDFVYDVAKLVFYQPWYAAWRNLDFAVLARAHYDAIGLAVPRFAERLACYCLSIGLSDMAYSAYRERWGQVESKARRIVALARA